MKSRKQYLCAVVSLTALSLAITTTEVCAAAGATNSLSKAQLARREYRAKWAKDATVGEYLKHGHRDPKWDDAAKSALEAYAAIYSRSDETAPQWQRLTNLLKVAHEKGCDDPLVRYIHLRYVFTSETHSQAEHAEAFRSLAKSMLQSEYAPIRKFYVCVRAAEFLQPKGPLSAESSELFVDARSQLAEALKDTSLPPGEVYDAANTLLTALKGSKQYLGQTWEAIEPFLFKNWPDESDLYLLKGVFYKDYAWQARGNSTADKVQQAGWRGFEQRLAEAEKALDKAWDLNNRDPRIPKEMITVELGQGEGRARMEKFFNRAMELDPNYYDACYAKLYYLEPKWYGSAEEMLEFGYECVRSKTWGGKVPLILADAHWNLAAYMPVSSRTNYWKNPKVWADIKEAYDKFFKLNPEAVGYHHNYAWYAYYAGQWNALNREIKLLGPVNYEFFGGKAEFDRMVSLAHEHATSPPK